MNFTKKAMFAYIIFLISLFGLADLVRRLTNNEAPTAFFISICFASVAMFVAFLVGMPLVGAIVILSMGFLGFLLYIPTFDKNKDRLIIASLLIFAIISIMMSYGMKYRSIDDYSFWATISKYLYIFNTLPTDNQFISSEFLTYTPGMAVFHYLLYVLNLKYSILCGYLAQNLVFFAALMAFIDIKKPKQSLMLVLLVFVVFNMVYGTVLARMEVDAYVAITFLACLWMVIVNKKSDFLTLVFPLIFLSIIKEIGLLFAISVVIIGMFMNRFSRKTWLVSLALIASIVSVKWLWHAHTHAFGFNSFSGSITLHLALSSLNPSNETFHVVQWLFLKAILFEPFGHVLKVPNIFIYIAMAFCIYKLESSRQRMALLILGLVVFLYAVFIYFLQAIVFKVGVNQSHLLDFSRYFNMAMLPYFLLSIMLYFHQNDCVKKPVLITLVALGLVLLVGGKIERTLKYYQPAHLYDTLKIIASHQKSLESGALCIKGNIEPSYPVILPLKYYLMPQKVIYPYDVQSIQNCGLILLWQDDRLLEM